MRIAFVTLQYPPGGVGGIGTYVETVAAALAAAGHEVTVVCAAGGQARSSTVEDGVRVERFGLLGPARVWERLVSPHQALRVRIHHAVSSAWALWRTSGRFDVVEVPEWKAQGLLLRFLRRGSVVVHLHLAFELQAAWNGAMPSTGWRISFALERWTARLAAARTATSLQTRRLPDGATWLAGAPVQVVAPPLRRGPWSACPPVEQTEPVVLFVGRLERRKAPEVLVEALGRLAGEVAGLRVVFVGRAMGADERSYAEVVQARAAELGVGCELVEPTADAGALGAHYARARVVAVPSRFETLSMVVFEALASGRPAVITDRVGAVEWIGGALPELVVPADDAEALAGALRPLLVDAERAGELGRRGRRLVDALTGADRVVLDRLRVYESVVGA